MRSILPVFGALLLTGASALAQGITTPSALEAVKLLPKDESKRLARIAAHEGKPAPERWHILVHAPEESSGVREYVIAGDEIVATRSVSQFAETLKESDVIGAEAIRIDSDKASKVAQQYVFANNVPVAAMDYELIREGDGAAPIWKITCVDETGMTVGSLVMTASKGTIVSHDGFPIQPAASQEKLTVEANTVVGNGVARDGAEAGNGNEIAPTQPSAPSANKQSTVKKPSPTSKKKTSSTSQNRERRSDDDDDDYERDSDRPRFFRRAGGKLQKFFTGRDTISR